MLLIEPDSTCRTVTVAPGTGRPSGEVTRPPTAEVVFCACADAAPSAMATQNAMRDRRRVLGFFMVLPWVVGSVTFFSRLGTATAAPRVGAAPHSGALRKPAWKHIFVTGGLQRFSCHSSSLNGCRRCGHPRRPGPERCSHGR